MITYTVQMETGEFQTADYDEARAWNRSHPGSTLDRSDNQ